MSFLLDPIESGINSLLDPLTSGITLPSATTAEPEQPSETMGNSQSTTTVETTPTATTASIVVPSATVEPSTTTATRTSSSSVVEETTSRSTRTSSTSDASTTSSNQSSLSSSTRTTLATSTTTKASSNSPSTISSTTSSTSSALAPPSTTPPLSPVQSNSGDAPPSSGPKISTAGIIVAIIFAVALFVSIIWLVIRFCPPVRRRIDAWSIARRQKRSYREAIDGPAPPEKDDGHSLSSYGSRHRPSVSAEAAEKIGVGKRPFSFFGVGAPASIEPKSGYTWKVESASGPVHQQYVSPNSADTPRGDGLGLGRVSLLRNHSLLRKAGYDVPPMPGPSMTQAQAEIASAGQAQKTKQLPLQPLQQEVKRKPLPVRLPVPVNTGSPRARPFSYEQNIGTELRPSRSTESTQSRNAPTRDRNSPMPRLQLDIPPTPVERRSQIGLAVTSSSPAVATNWQGHPR